MEIESLIAGGTNKAIKELLTVKSDSVDEKSNLISQIIETGEYHIPSIKKIRSITKEVVEVHLNFLKD